MARFAARAASGYVIFGAEMLALSAAPHVASLRLARALRVVIQRRVVVQRRVAVAALRGSSLRRLRANAF